MLKGEKKKKSCNLGRLKVYLTDFNVPPFIHQNYWLPLTQSLDFPCVWAHLSVSLAWYACERVYSPCYDKWLNLAFKHVSAEVLLVCKPTNPNLRNFTLLEDIACISAEGKTVKGWVHNCDSLAFSCTLPSLKFCDCWRHCGLWVSCMLFYLLCNSTNSGPFATLVFLGGITFVVWEIMLFDDAVRLSLCQTAKT